MRFELIIVLSLKIDDNFIDGDLFIGGSRKGW